MALRPLPSVPCLFILFPLMAAFYLAHGEDESPSNCSKEFSCGNVGYLEFPFAKHTQADCGLVAVNCDTTPPKIQFAKGEDWYHLQKVIKVWDGSAITVEDSKLRRLFERRNCKILNYTIQFRSSPSITLHNFEPYESSTFLKCNDHGQGDDHICNYERYNNCTEGYRLYFKRPLIQDPTCTIPDSCIPFPTPIFIDQTNDTLIAGLELKLQVSNACNNCYNGGGQCIADTNNEFQCEKGNTRMRKLKLILVSGGGGLILIFILILLLCITMKLSLCSCMDLATNKKNCRDVEEFLKCHGPLALKRFSYSEVKKITNSFKNELGHGGFGSVYKGKLHSGILVAVKVLKELRTSGEEFINEVASISRTSHVNIVTLIGFCFEGRKRALVYEFMSNGSLEKFIYDNKSLTGRQLEWNMLYKISISIARGLEYLHRGCNIRILHLDIKPHNILLDEDFSPKISDFGLAKLCTKQESIVSIHGARGTIGYIAPEVVCKNIGGVSQKSDVYSYGMMVLEMVGGRKNVDVGVSRNSKIYFPHWIYTRLVLDDELGLNGVMNEEENECARKMVIVSLWCIQTDPSTRPTMSGVVEMLEGKLENLQIPPQPYLYSPATEEQHSS